MVVSLILYLSCKDSVRHMVDSAQMFVKVTNEWIITFVELMTHEQMPKYITLISGITVSFWYFELIQPTNNKLTFTIGQAPF